MFEVESGCPILVRCGKKNMGSTTVDEHGIGNRVMLTTVNRRHIESLDFEPIFKILRQCGILDPSQASPENLTNLCYKVGVLVDGFKDEACELVEVPEVCRYFKALHQAWPFGLYFFNPQLETLQLLVWCNAGAKLCRDAEGRTTGVKVPADRLKQFIYSAMPHYFSIAIQLGWAPETATGQITNIAGLFETSAPECLPDSEEDLKKRHLLAIKTDQPALGRFASKSHHKWGRGTLMVAIGKLTYLIERDMADLVTGKSIEKLRQLVQQYDPATQFVICFCNGDGAHSYIVDRADCGPADEAN